MMSTSMMTFALAAFLLPLASEAGRAAQISRVQFNTSDFEQDGSCERDQVLPSVSAFDEFRTEHGIVEGEATADASKCTQQDVCLLMRQLDLDFFNRARIGDVTDAEATATLTQGWVHAGSCYTQEAKRGFRMQPVRSLSMCKRALAKRGVKKTQTVQWKSYPTGCVEVDKNGHKFGILNEVETDVEAFVKMVGGEESFSGLGRKRIAAIQFCEQDRKLDEASALYYSPYKIDSTMVERTEFSTSCSFGMMAQLSNTGATKSPCAKILAYRPPAMFEGMQAQDALDQAEMLEAGGDAAGAEPYRAFTAAMRQKNTLMEIVANQWCGGVWDSAIESGSTCSMPRSPDWAKDEKNQAGALFREPKMALTEESCTALAGGETLEAILENVSEVPPDFFREADI